ncbi:MAG: DUF3703 domain-containing protein [Saprospiraceae bacterium]|jgi:hypothetical protein|nr:DUF3703 domain-containing protein [Saprospiraceae bacterium]
MKVFTVMPAALKVHFYAEISLAASLFAEGNFYSSWAHLERAHILGQPYPYEHSLVHWKMLLFGVKTKNTKEIIGQIPRLLIGGVKSFVGKIPVGNTGGANVPPLQSMKIPDELLNIINEAHKKTDT